MLTWLRHWERPDEGDDDRRRQRRRRRVRMNYSFTDRVRVVLAKAREEAIRLQQEYVGTEQFLLGLVREGEVLAAAVLKQARLEANEIRHRLEESVRRGKAT